ncbi:hypothetical protein BDM02DRAFT_3105589, partial [Thelephora ganbajun]
NCTILTGITPNVLHQLYQGVMKHLMSWVSTAFSEKDLDTHCQSLPPNHNLWAFSKGITSLSWVTGKEHADMCRILLGLVIDFVRATCPMDSLKRSMACWGLVRVAKSSVSIAQGL